MEIKDIDGNMYKTIKIGKQQWMSENLNVNHFRNGDEILEVKTDTEWKKAGIEGKPAWCYYENKSSNGEKYSKLYNWYAINDSRGLAPDGYEIPTEQDINVMNDYVWSGGSGDQNFCIALRSEEGWFVPPIVLRDDSTAVW